MKAGDALTAGTFLHALNTSNTVEISTSERMNAPHIKNEGTVLAVDKKTQKQTDQAYNEA